MKWYKYDIRNLSDEEYEKWYSLMGEDKQKRVDRFRFSEDKKRTIAGEMLARIGISEWCGKAPEDIVFLAHKKGKPYASGLKVEFNVSHSENMVVCAISDKPIGIDVEKLRPVDLKIAKRICTEEELEYLFGHPAEEGDFKVTNDPLLILRFFKLWTAKEAYGKLLGTGLAVMNLPAKTDAISDIIDDEYFVSIICE